MMGRIIASEEAWKVGSEVQVSLMRLTPPKTNNKADDSP